VKHHQGFPDCRSARAAGIVRRVEKALFSGHGLHLPERENEMITLREPSVSGQNTPCTFRLEGVEAAAVALLGSFNEWSTTRHLMKRINGSWETQAPLPPGRHSYCFFAIEKADCLRGSLLRMGSTIEVETPIKPGHYAGSTRNSES
jgi:hypothetical protein